MQEIKWESFAFLEASDSCDTKKMLYCLAKRPSCVALCWAVCRLDLHKGAGYIYTFSGGGSRPLGGGEGFSR